MSTFSGSIIKQSLDPITENQTDYYDFRYGFGRVCGTAANYWRTGGQEDEFREAASWGYEGIGSELTAAYMLVASMYYLEWKDREALREKVKSLSVPFAREVIDHLPDSWTMTQEEVMEWVKKHEARG